MDKTRFLKNFLKQKKEKKREEVQVLGGRHAVESVLEAVPSQRWGWVIAPASTLLMANTCINQNSRWPLINAHTLLCFSSVFGTDDYMCSPLLYIEVAIA